jgi:hypothetical protein
MTQVVVVGLLILCMFFIHELRIRDLEKKIGQDGKD